MSRTAEDVTATLLSDGKSETSLNATDEIAALLIEEDDSTSEDEAGEETPAQSSTQEEETLDGEGEATDDEEEGEVADLDAIAEDDDATWAGALGVDESLLSFDEEGGLVGFNTKVNGESETIDLPTLLAGYQNNKAFTGKSQVHAEEVKAFEVRKGELETDYTSKLASVDALSKHFEKQLIGQYDNVNWEQLRIEDPAEYAAARHDFAAKAGELKNIMQAIETDQKEIGVKTAADQKERNGVYMKEQYDQLILNNPEWSDEKVRNTARDGFKTFVQEQYGFTDAEWNMVYDARLIELVKDAKKYRDGAEVAGKKRLKPVPKFQKSKGRGRKSPVSKVSKLAAAAKKATGSDKRNLQTSAVAALLLGD